MSEKTLAQERCDLLTALGIHIRYNPGVNKDLVRKLRSRLFKAYEKLQPKGLADVQAAELLEQWRHFYDGRSQMV